MKTNTILVAALVFLITACVSPKVYKDLESRYADLKGEFSSLQNEHDSLKTHNDDLEAELKKLQTEFNASELERVQLKQDLLALKTSHNQLKAAYAALQENSSAEIAKNAQKNRELLAQLEAKEQALAAENNRLQALESTLNSRSQRIAELEQIIAKKDAALNDLKTAISNALTDFEGKGLTVNQRNGKVYVSMENKLLFKSGSWAVGPQGREAVKQLGTVLADNPDISILIEGHTDNVPYSGNGPLQDNWDLSAKRATAIVSILRENNAIVPKNLTVAGRSEYAPVEGNDTAEGRAKNRRIEIILTPKLNEITKLISDF